MRLTPTAIFTVLLFSTMAHGQGLIINEASNGDGGSQDWVELLVVGDPAFPNALVDISGWKFDDNNGEFEGGGTGRGIAAGHLIFTSSWTSVPPGAIIVIYNNSSGQRDALIPPDDPTDSDGDLVYILAANHGSLDACSSAPSTSSTSYATCTDSPTWSRTAFANSGDVAQTRRPDGSFFHGFSYGNVTSPYPTFPGGGSSFNAGAGGTGSTFAYQCGDWESSSNILRSDESGRTPGTFNSSENHIAIIKIRQGTFDYTDKASAFNCVLDNDQDGIVDEIDLDDDNDGLLDTEESICVDNVAINSPGYAINTDFSGSSPLTGLGVNGTTSFDLYYSLEGGATWNDGVRIWNDGAILDDGRHIMFQPRNTDYPAGDVGRYVIDFNEAVMNLSFKWGGMDFNDIVRIEAFNEGVSVGVFETDFSNLTIPAANYSVIGGNAVLSTYNTAGNAPNNAFSFSLAHEVDRIVMTAGKNNGSSGNVTMQLFEIDYCTVLDTDGDGLADHLDIDSDGDGCFDVIEAGFTDSDNDGEVDGTGGYEADGTVTGSDGYTGTDPIVTDFNLVALSCDTDGDGINPFVDLDDDNDGIPDIDEGCGNLVLNGSFEAQDFSNATMFPGGFTDASGTFIGTSYNSNVLFGWEYDQNLDGWIGGQSPSWSSNTFADAYDGNQFIDITGNNDVTFGVNNTLTQKLPTIPGQDYELSFYWGEDVGHTNGEIITIEVDVIDDDALAILDTTLIGNATGVLGGLMGPNAWNYFSQSFTATTDTSTISFHATPPSGSTSAGAALDFVSFRPIDCLDSDGDGIADYLDLDSDNDGIFDLEEAGHAQVDADADGAIDGAPTAFGSNGLFDGVETTPDSGVLDFSIIDTDGDGVLDSNDLDSDNDGIYDVIEGGSGALDANNDGVIDISDLGFSDANQDGMDDDASLITPTDSDGDGIIDAIELDSDNDGCLDVIEAGYTDPNGDGLLGDD